MLIEAGFDGRNWIGSGYVDFGESLLAAPVPLFFLSFAARASGVLEPPRCDLGIPSRWIKRVLCFNRSRGKWSRAMCANALPATAEKTNFSREGDVACSRCLIGSDESQIVGGAASSFW